MHAVRQIEKLTAEDRAKLEAEGRRPHWRFLLEPRVVAWTDLIRGDAHVDCASLSDQAFEPGGLGLDGDEPTGR